MARIFSRSRRPPVGILGRPLLFALGLDGAGSVDEGAAANAATVVAVQSPQPASVIVSRTQPIASSVRRRRFHAGNISASVGIIGTGLLVFRDHHGYAKDRLRIDHSARNRFRSIAFTRSSPRVSPYNAPFLVLAVDKIVK